MSAVAGGPWTRRLRTAEDARALLVCFPPAGATAMFFLPMAQAIARPIDVISVQYPGRQDRRNEPCAGSIDELADGVVAELLNSHSTRAGCQLPVALFGHGMGASVAFETATRLELLGVAPIAVVASGRTAPSRQRPGTTHLADDDTLIRDLAALGPGAPLPDDSLDPVRTPTTALRGDYTAAETYRWRSDHRLNCYILAMVGDCDPTATVDEVRSWSEVTRGRFELQVFSGRHFYISSFVSTVANTISERVAALLPCEPCNEH